METNLFGPGYLGRSSKFDAQRMVNFYPEIGSESQKSSGALVGTPGTSLFCDTGANAIRGMHVFNDVLYVVISNKLYSVSAGGVLSSQIGNNLQTSSGRVVMTDNGVSPTGGDQLIIVDGTYKYIYCIASTWYWEAQSLPSSKNWECISSDGEYFVALASGGTTGYGAKSLDGEIWTAVNLSTSGIWRAIAHNGTQYCALSYGSTNAMTSPDGETWTTRTLPSASNWRGIAWNGSVWCAIAYNSNVAATSSDGITWTARTLPSTSNWISITAKGSTFCAIAYNGTTAATSTDGITWTAQTLPVSANWYDITNDGTNFLAVSQGIFFGYSSDGASWSQGNMPTSANWSKVVHNGNCLCVITDNGSSVATTKDTGITWLTNTVLPTGDNWSGLAWNGEMYCVVDYDSQTAATSPYGSDWDGGRFIEDDIAANTVCFLGGYFIMDIGGGQFQVSDLYNGLRLKSLYRSTADSSPDNLLAVFANHNELWLLGKYTTEIWYQSGICSPPFARISGGVLDYGLAARHSVAKGSNTIFWLATQKNNQSGESFGIVLANGYSVKKISTPAIDYQISQYSDISDAWGYCYSDGGHDFYVITFPTADVTWCYDLITGYWHERSEYTGPPTVAFATQQHLAGSYVYYQNKHYVGRHDNGKLCEMTSSEYEDVASGIGTEPIECFKIFSYITDKNNLNNIIFNNVQIDIEIGTTETNWSLSWSDDGGNSWSDEITKSSWGQVGVNYYARQIWRKLGMARQRIFRLRCLSYEKKIITSAYIEGKPTRS